MSKHTDVLSNEMGDKPIERRAEPINECVGRNEKGVGLSATDRLSKPSDGLSKPKGVGRSKRGVEGKKTRVEEKKKCNSLRNYSK